MQTGLNPINNMILEERRKSALLRISGVLALIAGCDLIFSGYTSNPILLTFLMQISIPFAQYMTPTLLYWIELITSTLSILVGLGGFLVIIGGLLFFRKHKSLGKFLILLGGGIGILGLVFSMIEAYYLSGFSLVVFHAEYWVGIILA